MTAQHHACATCGRTDVKLYRAYGSFLREAEIFCKAHVPADQASWYVPLVEDLDGSVWGYTSVPDEAIRRWEALNDG